MSVGPAGDSTCTGVGEAGRSWGHRAGVEGTHRAEGEGGREEGERSGGTERARRGRVGTGTSLGWCSSLLPLSTPRCPPSVEVAVQAGAGPVLIPPPPRSLHHRGDREGAGVREGLPHPESLTSVTSYTRQCGHRSWAGHTGSPPGTSHANGPLQPTKTYILASHDTPPQTKRTKPNRF